MTNDHRLDDAAVSAFLRDGLLLLQPPELDAAFHAQCFAAADGLYASAKREGGSTAHLRLLGDNLLAQVPALNTLLAAPSVRGALTSLLGEGCVLHPHQFVHSAGRADQGFHQDGNLPWNTRGHFRSPRPIAAILFYYPQAVTDEMGPTEVLPGTQYWRGSFEDGVQWHGDDHLDRAFDADAGRHPDLARRDAAITASLGVLGTGPVTRKRLCVPAGTVALLHYDLVHRGTRQATGFDGRRYLYKFYFLRTQEPRRAAWNNRSPHPVGAPPATALDAGNAAIVERNWQWLRGEPAGLAIAPGQVASLAQTLCDPDERIRRDAGYALSDSYGAGSDAVLDALCAAIDRPEVTARRMAAFALGETRSVAPRCVEALLRALADADTFVRSNAAFSLGSLARVQALPATAIDALLARLDPLVEPDNTQSAGLSRSTVRECVLQALLMAASNDGLSDAQLQQLAARGLADTGRYVRGLTVQALLKASRDAVPPWIVLLLRHLDVAQYHALPAPEASALAVQGEAPRANSPMTMQGLRS